MNNEIYIKKNEVERINFIGSTKSDYYMFFEERTKKRLFGFRKPEVFEAGWYLNYNIYRKISTDRILEDYYVDSNNILWFKARIQIVTQTQSTIDVYFNTNSEAKTWLDAFISDNDLNQKLIVIKR